MGTSLGFKVLSEQLLVFISTLPPPQSGEQRWEFQSTDSCGHSEVLGYSHFLLLFENELTGPGGCMFSAAGFSGRKCFWSLLITEYYLLTVLYLQVVNNEVHWF